MIYFIIDIIVFVSILYFSSKIDKLTFYHPMVWFLLSHFYTITYRLFQILFLKSPIINIFNVIIPIEGIYRAVLYADLGLIVLFIGFFFAKNKSLKSEKSS